MADRLYRPTKRRNNWERLVATFEWLNMNSNAFAMHIGFTRAENLYHIKRGSFGITSDLANRITKHFPEINRTWLLTGAGNMLTSQVRTGNNIPYYDGDIETLLPIIDELEPSGYIDLPLFNGCDIIIKSSSNEMADKKNINTQLFLRHVDPTEVKQGDQYVFLLHKQVLWRKVESVDGYQITLSTVNSDSCIDISIDTTDIIHAWLVVAKMDVIAY